MERYETGNFKTLYTVGAVVVGVIGLAIKLPELLRKMYRTQAPTQDSPQIDFDEPTSSDDVGHPVLKDLQNSIVQRLQTTAQRVETPISSENSRELGCSNICKP